MKLILGSVIILIMGVCFFRISYHAVLMGRPVLVLLSGMLATNALKNDGLVFGNSYIKSYNYSGGENTYFSTNGKIKVDAGANFAAEAPQDLGSIVRDQYLDDVKVFLTMNGGDGTTTLTDPVGGQTIRFNGSATISTDNKKFGFSLASLKAKLNCFSASIWFPDKEYALPKSIKILGFFPPFL